MECQNFVCLVKGFLHCPLQSAIYDHPQRMYVYLYRNIPSYMDTLCLLYHFSDSALFLSSTLALSFFRRKLDSSNSITPQ